MKTTIIDMSTVKGKNPFENVEWKNATAKEISEAFGSISKSNNSRKKVA